MDNKLVLFDDENKMRIKIGENIYTKKQYEENYDAIMKEIKNKKKKIVVSKTNFKEVTSFIMDIFKSELDNPNTIDRWTITEENNISIISSKIKVNCGFRSMGMIFRKIDVYVKIIFSEEDNIITVKYERQSYKVDDYHFDAPAINSEFKLKEGYEIGHDDPPMYVICGYIKTDNDEDIYNNFPVMFRTSELEILFGSPRDFCFISI